MPGRARTIDPNAGREWSILKGGQRDRRVYYSDEIENGPLGREYTRTDKFVLVEKIYSYIPVKSRDAIAGKSARVWTHAGR